MKDVIPTEAARKQGPLVFQLRSRRQWHDESKLTQVGLAGLSGVSRRTLQTYERLTVLPKTIANLYAIALTLGVTIEDLITAPARKEIIDAVARRELRLLPRDNRQGRSS